MARKLGIYMSEPLEALISGRQEMDSLSGRLSTVAERYAWIIEEHKPELTEAEWNACRDSLNGTFLKDMFTLKLVWANVDDADDDGLGEKWGIDAKALARRIREMKPAELVSLVESVEAWWAEQG